MFKCIKYIPVFVIIFSTVFFVVQYAGGAVLYEGDSPGITEVEEDGRRFVQDTEKNYRLLIPAPYWEYRTPLQIREESGGVPGGCSPGGGVPESMLLMIENKDAHGTGVSLEKLPHRFMLRDKSDLRDYVARQENAVLAQMEEKGDLVDSHIEILDEMVVYKSFYEFIEQDQDLRVILANYFVRPPQQDIIVFQLQAFALNEWYDLLEQDLKAMAGGFSYTGRVAEEFFQPDAPEEKLPSAHFERSGSPPQCGGNISSIIFVCFSAIAVFLIFKKKSRGSA